MLPALIVTFIAVPVIELYLIFTVSRHIGLLPTLAILLAVSVVGGVIVKREGGRAWGALRQATAAGRLPGREIADGALVLVGGALLLTPGFLTDAVGLLLVLPVTRPLARRLLLLIAARRAARRLRHRPGRGRVIDVPGGHGDADRR
jgi:UPF0716 protein FxsA